jgi:hypothetical protein
MDDVSKENEEIDNYYCKKCKYSTKNKKDYNKHLSSYKHKNEINKCYNHKCLCGTICNSRTTLWRHKKKCINSNEKIINQQQENINNLTLSILQLVKSNNQLFEFMKNNINPKIT